MPISQQAVELPQKEKKKSSKSPGILVTGFALFSMFFGAGNLIFPLIIGHSSGQNNLFAFLGLSLTAVVVPFLGLYAMTLYEASYDRFFSRLGKIEGKFILAILIAIQGPFAALPRLITLMHATLKMYMPNLSLRVFSLVICAVIFFLSAKKSRLIKLLGLVLTPLLFASLICFVYYGLTTASASHIVGTSNSEAFKEGLIGGYNTTDLIASFLFAALVFPYLQKDKTEESYSNKGYKNTRMLKASLLASFLLLAVYAGLSYVSSYHMWTLSKVPSPESMLSALSVKLLGPYGAVVASVAVFMACLTTAITLISIFADFVKDEVSEGKIEIKWGMITGLFISMSIANLGFSGIAKVLSPILQVLYPGLILMSFLNIAYCKTGFRPIKIPVFATFLIAAIVYFFS